MAKGEVNIILAIVTSCRTHFQCHKNNIPTSTHNYTSTCQDNKADFQERRYIDTSAPINNENDEDRRILNQDGMEQIGIETKVRI